MAGTSKAIQALREIGPIKTWSLLVTVFGDMDAGPDAPLAGPDLNRLFEAMGVKREAVRVALHRLIKDDWIRSRRVGRTSEYVLTPASLAETRAARARIYGTAPEGLADWYLHVCPAPIASLPVPNVRLTPSSCIANGPRLSGSESLSAPMIGALPDWVREICLPRDARLTLERLMEIDLDAAAGPLERQAMRMLVLHHWRRLALRDGTWVLIALDRDGPVGRCQARVLNLLGESPETNHGSGQQADDK